MWCYVLDSSLRILSTSVFNILEIFNTIHYIRPHRMHWMHRCSLLLTVVCVSACLCVRYNRELYKNGWTDREAAEVVDSWPKEPHIRWGSRSSGEWTLLVDVCLPIVYRLCSATLRMYSPLVWTRLQWVLHSCRMQPTNPFATAEWWCSLFPNYFGQSCYQY